MTAFLGHHEWLLQCDKGGLAPQRQRRCEGELARGFQRHRPSGRLPLFDSRWTGFADSDAHQAGWMGKGKDSNSDRADHVSQPLSSLKDPASFGPPPKHHGRAAVPSQSTPDCQALGAPLTQDQIHSQDAQAEEEAARRPAPPPVPYRLNTTGLSTNNLPPPPVRRLDSPADSPSSATTTKPKPQLPPRLPPRSESSAQPTSPPAYSPTPPSPSQGYVNQQAVSRLSNAGVSVPALGIGEGDGRQAQTSAGARDAAPVNKLQSRFSQMRTNSAFSPSAPSSPARPATNEEPRAGSSSVQDFRERHADKIEAGKQKLGGITSRINTFVEDRKFSADANKRIPRPPAPPHGPSEQSTVPENPAARKKPPPPPPPKRADIRAAPVAAEGSPSSPDMPPPVPTSTKPR